jgi:two-component system sensor histidine kinase UhpB
MLVRVRFPAKRLDEAATTGPPRGMSLLARVLVLNGAVIVGAFLLVALTPVTVSARVTAVEGLALGLIIAGALAANVLAVRLAFAPLRRLARVMHGIDPLQPGVRIAVDHGPSDVRELEAAFNAMLERLEDERRDSARRAVLAQEAERRRVARELHDELGQTLTGVLLQTDALAREPSATAIEQAREDARHALEQVRRIARDLRPDTLDELGLLSSIQALATTFTRQSGVHAERELAASLPQLDHDAEVVLYRVAQEALTNVARHAAARRVRIALAHDERHVRLLVDDDGRGPPTGAATEGRGITGMRERALLVRGRLALERSPAGGTRVSLEVPVAR